jgi:filamentous hemagglutinin
VNTTSSSGQAAAAPGGMEPGNRPPTKGKDGRVKKLLPAESPIWRQFSNAGRGRKTSGTGRDQRYYEWDYTHGDIEVYDRRGRHLGTMEPTTGDMYKDPVKGRSIDL